MILFFILLLLFSPLAKADTYAVEKPDGSVVIANYFENSSEGLDNFLKDVGLFGLPIKKIDPSTLPSRSDRNYWKISSNSVTVDNVEKSKDLAKKAQKEARKANTLEKLGVNEGQLKEALEKN